MNINKIFSLFKSSEEPEEIISQLDSSESPIIWIGMFKKMIVNYETLAKQLIQMFKLSEPSLDVDEIERASSYMVYNKAYTYLIKFDLNNQTHLDTLQLYSDKTLKFTLDKALSHFEYIEEYEKCMFLKNIQDIVNSFKE